METGIGDRLASGRAASAQFGGAGIDMTDFEGDFIFKPLEFVCQKYGISQEEYDKYAVMRLNNEKLPDLKSVEEQKSLEVGFSVSDRRSAYLTESPKIVEEAPKKFPEPEYEPIQTLMDRILVMVVSDDPDEELLDDGSTRNRKTGLITTSKYRQHSNVGVVLLSGQWVVTGGVRIPMSELVKPGDRVIYGDYGSELMKFNDEKAEALCDSVGVNYVKTDMGLRIVRIQDVRTIERRKVSND